MLNARVIDQNIDAAEIGSRLFHHRLDLLGLAHVGTVIRHLDAKFRGESRANSLDFCGIAEAVQDEVNAFPGKPFGNT